MDILVLLGLAKGKLASDLHLLAGEPPIFRVHGSLERLEDAPPITPEQIDEALARLATPEQRDDFTRRLELDFGCTIPDVGRIRCNAGKQRGTTSLAIRLLPSAVPSVEELGLPQLCKDLVLRPRGLIIVSGPTGSGKSTTLAAMIRHLNTNEKRRVVTIEDPIEYIHEGDHCAITQRQIGTDTHTFAEALRHVLRQDPDVILVGEMRDAETAAAVLNVAETGHLILTTGHAPSSAQTMERVVDLFPINERHLAQTRLASLILGVMCQALVPKADRTGRVAAVEVMLANAAVRNLVRDGKIYQLPNVIQTHTRDGMQLLDQALIKLYFERAIDYQSLLAFCNDKPEVERLAGSRT